MIAFDTNVLVRFLLADEPRQHAALLRKLRRHADAEIFLNDVVLAETVWVLKARYGFDKSAQLDVLNNLLSNPQFVFEDEQALLRATYVFEESAADFADCLIAEKNVARGVDATWTFDRRAAKTGGFEAVSM